MKQIRLFLVCLIAAFAGSSVMASDTTSSSPKESLTIQGLQEQVEIIKDHWGIPHIFAQNQKDLFFAQGINVARDRLFHP